MVNETYTYSRLDASCAKPFRVLILQPSTGPDVHISLTEASLGSHIEFEALSYTWGSPEELHFVQCDGKALKVTKNCKQALQHLRTSQPRTLWVDAVCIDQSLHQERNQQVTMMQEIYEKATRVVIWLSSPTRDLDVALFAVKLLADMLRTEANVQPEHDGCRQLLNHRGMERALTAMADLPWWRRIWVVQEVYASSNAVVKCGISEVPWVDFEVLGRWAVMTGVERLPFHIGHVAQRIGVMISLKGRRSPLPSALAAYENQEATDPRDKIFALQGLLHESSRIRVDYSLTTEDILMQASRRCLEVTNCFDALRPWDFSCRDEAEGRTDSLCYSLPSWVRDVSVPRVGNMIEVYADFSASRHSKPLYEFQGRRLVIRCKVFDTISLCGAYMSCESPQKFIPAVRMWWAVVFSLRRYPTGERLLDVFRHLLTSMSHHLGRESGGESQAFTRNMFGTWISTIGFEKSPAEAEAAVRRDKKLGLLQDMLNVPIGLRVCTTAKSYVGAVPPSACSGDLIAIPAGSSKPYVFRERCDGTYRILGPCYVHGIMLGEYWMGKGGDEVDSDLQEITIV
ncbi:heterokaryon incompatibility protein-domain-containing protein [Lasiosphaeria hispida]|uniref:Heterokaryon incompatibility protein-domain-containing protein n=1 Tax=Lasiosphaeria hispida TaxID=260671 RepID=A0AAJ0HGA6_9PEZI|nr:heterokaryon incompatibility protein-domain-containing protein [Lasiosphaeria hispida]